MNKWIGMGNLGADPELRMTSGGNACLKFNLATTEKWNDKQSGQKQERTEWHRCVMWGPRAEGLAKYLSKGSKVLVEGRIHYDSYDKDGIKRYTTDIVVSDLEFAGDSKSGEAPKRIEPEKPKEEDFDPIPF